MRANNGSPLDEVEDEALSTGNDLAVADLIDAAEADREPLSSARDAVAALEMILGAYEAEITGGRGGVSHAAARASVFVQNLQQMR